MAIRLMLSLALVAVVAASNLGCGGGEPEQVQRSRPSGKSGDAGATKKADGKAKSADTAKIGATGEGWGTLKGRFVYGGDVPMMPELNPTKDQEVCGKFKLVDNSLVVGDSKGVANIVIYLRPERGVDVPVHESYQSEMKEVVLDNQDCMFEPHVQTLWTEQTLLVKNSDPIAHNTNITVPAGESINPLLPAGDAIEHKFANPQRIPLKVSCNIHPWMTAYVLPSATPYVTVTDKEGNFTIENLPEGNWEFQVWHEQAGYLEAKPEWSKGRFTQAIAAGDNDLGEITLDPAVFMSGAE